MYVPSAAALTGGGFFYARGDSGTYDTLRVQRQYR